MSSILYIVELFTLHRLVYLLFSIKYFYQSEYEIQCSVVYYKSSAMERIENIALYLHRRNDRLEQRARVRSLKLL